MSWKGNSIHMRNELWKMVTGLHPEETEIGQLEYIPATAGSPYDEVVNMEQHRITVNPYIRYGEMLEELLCNRTFFQSSEGLLLFQESVGLLLDIERYDGFDRNSFLKKIVEKEILENSFGKDICRFYQILTVEEKKRTLENIVAFYRQRQTISAFVREIVALFPQSLLFQEKGVSNHVYLYMGTPKTKEKQWKIEKCKELFLALDTKVHIAWEEAFLLTDMHRMENIGNCIV